MAQISSFGGLQTSLRGLLAHQRMLDVTSHNISNADTEGYTRQRAVSSAAPGLVLNGATGHPNYLGQGVDVVAYDRVRNQFLDSASRAQSMLLGERSALAEGLSRVDQTIAEPGGNGLSSMLSAVWTGFQTLASNPTDDGARAQVVSAAQTLTTAIADLDARLATIGGDAADQYAKLAVNADSPIAAAAKELAQLNDAIKRATTAGQQPNDMLDRRDLLLDRLAQYGQVTVTAVGHGEIRVEFGDSATPLVDGTTTNWPLALTNPGGQLGGLQALQVQVAEYRSELDGFAASLAGDVNALHGTPPFFSGTTAATITVAVTPGAVTAGSGAGAESNDIARAIAALRGGTAEQGYHELVRRIGSDAANTASLRSLSATLVEDIEGRRQSVAGVSLDEEMTDLIRFQRGYQASSRALSSIDEMLDQLINRTGRVGL